MADRFFIAPYDTDSGLRLNVRPWLIPDTAFEVLENAYVYRGRVRKRVGSQLIDDGNDPLLSRLRVKVGTTNGAGVLAGLTPQSAGNPIVTPAIGQMFSISGEIYTVQALGNPVVMISTDASAVKTFDTTTGAFVFNTPWLNTDVYYYPALPVMGLLTYEASPISNERCIAFDTRFAYERTNGWQRLDTFAAAPEEAFWTGNDSQFFWGTTWIGNDPSERAFYVTNFKENEPRYMRCYLNGNWTEFRPIIQTVPGTVYLDGARILVVFKNMLVALNTWEGDGIITTNYPNRARCCLVNASPFAANAWLQNPSGAAVAGNGYAVDAATMESIVSVEFIKDRLIVFFERSTWELVFQANREEPITWQKVNTELGAESTFSTVPFDKVILTVGSVGIHACNGANVERIDNQIPNLVFNVHNQNQGTERVYGIRDYETECVYWTIPTSEANADNPYPKAFMTYNYRSQTWSINKDSITAFGYFQKNTGVTWDSQSVTWDDDVSWDEGVSQALTRNIVAGNQQGYTFLFGIGLPKTAPNLQITNITVPANIQLTIVNHNLDTDDYLAIGGIVWSDASNVLNNKIYKVQKYIDKDTIEITPDATDIITGTYRGGGIIARVSRVNIVTKEYNFYADKARNAYVSRVDFMVDTAAAAQYEVKFFVSTSEEPLLSDGSLTGSLVGTSSIDTFPYVNTNIPKGVKVLYPYERTASRLWRPVYLQADGEVIQLQITMNDQQLRDVAQYDNDFQLHAMVFHAVPTSDNLQ